MKKKTENDYSPPRHPEQKCNFKWTSHGLEFEDSTFNEIPICYVYNKEKVLIGHISRVYDYAINVWTQCVPFITALDMDVITKKLFSWKGWK